MKKISRALLLAAMMLTGVLAGACDTPTSVCLEGDCGGLIDPVPPPCEPFDDTGLGCPNQDH